uniref:Transmembrane protein n=1 Tax=Heterorhabditis bacteriophora TaxID=37862 RepID=A0A1I7WI44_HETBA
MQRTKDILPKHMIGLLRQVSDQGKVVLITLITSLFTIMPVGKVLFFYSFQGSLSCFMHISVCFGAAMGAILSLDFMLGGVQTWGILLALPAVLGVFILLINNQNIDKNSQLKTKQVESSGRRPLLLKTLTLCLIADCLLLIFSLLSSNQDEQWASWGTILLLYNFITLNTEIYSSTDTSGTYFFSIIFIIVLWYFLPETRFNYKEDPLEIRILHDLGPLTYGAIDLEDINQF